MLYISIRFLSYLLRTDMLLLDQELNNSWTAQLYITPSLVVGHGVWPIMCSERIILESLISRIFYYKIYDFVINIIAFM